MSKLSRLLVLLSSALVLAALATPLWRIRLLAPQYPEGLGMDIHAGTVVGAREHDLQSINSLNHYIGMKAIEPEEIAELRIIPWCIAGLALFGLGVAVVGRRWMAIGWLASFGVLGVVAFTDFYHWEYEYGHDLDSAHAIIKMPGNELPAAADRLETVVELYGQLVAGHRRDSHRPRIRCRVLVAVPGALAPSAGGGVVIRARRRFARAAVLSLVVACAPAGPDEIDFGVDICSYCRMLIGDSRFAAAIVTARGRTVKFDSIECLLAYYRQASTAVASVWVSDVRHPGVMLDATSARFIDLGEVRAPMGRAWAAVASARDAAALGVIDAGAIKRWSEIQ